MKRGGAGSEGDKQKLGRLCVYIRGGNMKVVLYFSSGLRHRRSQGSGVKLDAAVGCLESESRA